MPMTQLQCPEEKKHLELLPIVNLGHLKALLLSMALEYLLAIHSTIW